MIRNDNFQRGFPSAAASRFKIFPTSRCTRPQNARPATSTGGPAKTTTNRGWDAEKHKNCLGGFNTFFEMFLDVFFGNNMAILGVRTGKIAEYQSIANHPSWKDGNWWKITKWNHQAENCEMANSCPQPGLRTLSWGHSPQKAWAVP